MASQYPELHNVAQFQIIAAIAMEETLVNMNILLKSKSSEKYNRSFKIETNNLLNSLLIICMIYSQRKPSDIF